MKVLDNQSLNNNNRKFNFTFLYDHVQYFQCEGELAKLKHDDVVRNIGLGYTDGLSSVDGMRQMSVSDEQVEAKNVAPEKDKESTKVSKTILNL